MNKYIYIITMKNSNFSSNKFNNTIQKQISMDEYCNNMPEECLQVYRKFKNNELLFFKTNFTKNNFYYWFIKKNDAIEI